MRNREDILKNLFARTTQGIKFGLERISEAAACINNPQNAYNSIHVAGTNGKGSVCAFLESILRFQGYSTGMFTSPHIVRFEERFIINGKPVTTQQWLDVYQDIEDIANRYSLTFFEISALIAFELFKREKVDWAILETGMGGRLDATNIVIPRASVVTNIGIDHTEYLGSDILSIAKEKFGIIKENIPLIIVEQDNSEIMDTALRITKEKKSPCIVVDKKEACDMVQTDYGNTFKYKNTCFAVPLNGTYQVMNALCAIKSIELLKLAKEEIMVEAISKTFSPARFQTFEVKGKKVVFDVAHNPQATGELCELIKQRFRDTPVCIVAGILADKDAHYMFQKYAECADSIIITQPKTPRAAPIDELVEKVPESFKKNIQVIDNVEDAVNSALEKFDGIVCITGSFYTVGEAMSALELEPYAD